MRAALSRSGRSVRDSLTHAPSARLRGGARSLMGGVRSPVRLGDEVRAAKLAGRPVVALESTIVTHGVFAREGWRVKAGVWVGVGAWDPRRMQVTQLRVAPPSRVTCIAGMKFPDNLATARDVERIVREGGSTPATVAVLDRAIRVGLDDAELELLAKAGPTVRKASRRDLAVCVASGEPGATTVAGTMIAAHMADIPVFVTGGIGGVHRGGESTLDVSADLTELGRTPVTVVCAGVKSILDIERTLEVLETQGVTVATLGQPEFPAFFSPSSGLPSPIHLRSVEEAAELVAANRALGLESGIVLAVPNPEPAEAAVVQEAIDRALAEAAAAHIHGRDVTPFLLKRVAELTGGASLRSNIALVRNNARVGAELARLVARIEQGTTRGGASKPTPSSASPPKSKPVAPGPRRDGVGSPAPSTATTKATTKATTTTTATSATSATTSAKMTPRARPQGARSFSTRASLHAGERRSLSSSASTSVFFKGVSARGLATLSAPEQPRPSPESKKAEYPGAPLVVGGAMIDVIARPLRGSALVKETSNPGQVTQQFGGVGRNIAEGLARLEADPVLVSAVGDDVAGDAVRQHCETVGIRTLPSLRRPGHRTPTYCALLEDSGNLVVAIADAEAVETMPSTVVRSPEVREHLRKAGMVVADGNVNQETLEAILDEANDVAELAAVDFGSGSASSTASLTAASGGGAVVVGTGEEGADEDGGSVLDLNALRSFQRLGVPVWFEPTSMEKAKRGVTVKSLAQIAIISPNRDEIIAMAEEWDRLTESFATKEYDGIVDSDDEYEIAVAAAEKAERAEKDLGGSLAERRRAAQRAAAPASASGPGILDGDLSASEFYSGKKTLSSTSAASSSSSSSSSSSTTTERDELGPNRAPEVSLNLNEMDFSHLDLDSPEVRRKLQEFGFSRQDLEAFLHEYTATGKRQSQHHAEDARLVASATAAADAAAGRVAHAGGASPRMHVAGAGADATQVFADDAVNALYGLQARHDARRPPPSDDDEEGVAGGPSASSKAPSGVSTGPKRGTASSAAVSGAAAAAPSSFSTSSSSSSASEGGGAFRGGPESGRAPSRPAGGSEPDDDHDSTDDEKNRTTGRRRRRREPVRTADDDDSGDAMLWLTDELLGASQKVLAAMCNPAVRHTGAGLVDGRKHVLVTLGKHGTLWLSAEPCETDEQFRDMMNLPFFGASLASKFDFYLLKAPRASLRNATGSGDTMVAGTVAAICEGRPMDEALLIGLAAAKLSVESETAVPTNLGGEKMREALWEVCEVNPTFDASRRLKEAILKEYDS